MQLESSVLSSDRIKEVEGDFEWVKLDVREIKDPSVMRHKSTRYVPEVVMLDSSGNLIDRLEAHDVESFRAFLDRAKK